LTDFDRIGQITPTGLLVEFPVATPVPYATDIVVGPDGNVCLNGTRRKRKWRADITSSAW
jgi:hypothetical protein